MKAKIQNPHRISVIEWLEREGYDTLNDGLEEVGYDSVVPALCDESCEVEPDGRCEHGCPSVLVALGLI